MTKICFVVRFAVEMYHQGKKYAWMNVLSEYR